MSNNKLHPAAETALQKFVLNLWDFEKDVHFLQDLYPNKFSYPVWDSKNDCEYTADPTPNQEFGDIYAEVVPMTDQILTLLGFDSVESFQESVGAEVAS